MLKKLFYISAVLFTLSLLFISSPDVEARDFFGRTHQLPPLTLASGEGEILINFTVPKNFDFAYEAPSTLWTRAKDLNVFKTIPLQTKKIPLDLSKLPFSIGYKATPGMTVVAIDLRAHFCDKETQICLTDNIRLKIPVFVKEIGSTKTTFTIPLRAKI